MIKTYYGRPTPWPKVRVSAGTTVNLGGSYLVHVELSSREIERLFYLTRGPLSRTDIARQFYQTFRNQDLGDIARLFASFRAEEEKGAASTAPAA